MGLTSQKLQILIGAFIRFRGEDHRAAKLGEITQKRESLFPELKGIRTELAQLGHPVDENPARFERANLITDAANQGFSFDLRRREDVVILRLSEVVGARAQIEEMDLLHPKAKNPSIARKLLLAFPER